MKFLKSGKVKDVYEYDAESLLFRFSDRVSAFDVKFDQPIPQKGEVLCKFAEYWFDILDVPNHLVRRRSDTEMIVRRMEMLPIECVVRGYFYGSLAKRCENGSFRMPEGEETVLGAKLSDPLFDPTTKAEHDVPIDKTSALSAGLVTEGQYDLLASESVAVYNRMAAIADSAGFILADLKLEFGMLDGRIVLGDSVGPDEFRLWPKESYEPGRIQEAYDKQILRDWLAGRGHAAAFDEARAAGREPVPPAIPPEIVSRMTARYVEAYRRFTGAAL